MALADLNGDGKPDLVVSNYNNTIFGINNHAGTIAVLLGNGDGTFQAQNTFAAGYVTKSLAVADLNGDGKPDLVVGNLQSKTGTYTVSVVLGNGDGTFQSRRTFASGKVPSSVVVGDVNGDGKPDLVVANSNYKAIVSVLLGNGDGTFQAPTTFAAGSTPFSVTMGDVNGDGKPDLVVNDRSLYSAGVLLGNGNGTFQTPSLFPTGSFPQFLLLGDANSDGKLDLITTRRCRK